MKKLFFITAIILFAFKGFGQYFNHQIPNYYFDAGNRQTITKNSLNEIVFLSVNQRSPNHPRDFELVKLDRAGNYLLSKRVFDTMGSLIPVSIITTYDTAYIVIGTYMGIPPVGYPHIPGGNLQTTFYAKFDNNFNLIWFKLHYGYPLDQPHVVQNHIDPYGLTAVPGNPAEDYIVLNFGQGFDTVTNSVVQCILIDKIDEFGNLIREVRPNIPAQYFTHIISSISYLPANNLCAITGGFMNTSIASWPSTSFIFTFDVGLTTVFNFTHYTSPFETFVPSNVVEDQANTNNLLFCFSTRNPSPYPMTCSAFPKATSLAYLKVKAIATSSIVTQRNYTSSCMQSVRPPFIIKNIPGEPDNVMIGLTEAQPGWYFAMSNVPALLKLNTNASVINYHHYNPLDPLSVLQYFDNYEADSFVLHINQTLVDTSNATRIIKTDGMGATYCTTRPVVDTFIDSIVGIDSSLILIVDSTILVDDYPVLNIDSFVIYPCDSAFGKPTPGFGKNTSIAADIRIYPNPAYDELNIISDGHLNSFDNIRIVNSMGQVVVQKITDMPVNNSAVNIRGINSGLYFIEISNKAGLMIKKKFVKM